MGRWSRRLAGTLLLLSCLACSTARTPGKLLPDTLASDGNHVSKIRAISGDQRTEPSVTLQHSSRLRKEDDDAEYEEEEMDDKSFLLLAAGEGADEDDEDNAGQRFCRKNKYRKRTLKVVKEIPFVGLFPELQRTRRFEGSGIAYGKGHFWVVFDSLRSLGRLDLRFSFRGPENALVGPVGEESQYEGISYLESTDTFFVLRESFEHAEHGLVPVVQQLKLVENGTNYQTIEHCVVQFELQDVNKGFESLVVFERDGQRHMLGLCESNYCKTVGGSNPPGLQRGNGRLVWATYRAPEDEMDECEWRVEKVIHVPEQAYFLDYSAISFRGDFGADVAIVSQEDAAVWVGAFDWSAMDFVEGSGRVYHFPRGEYCAKQYCNVEGVAWVDAERLVFASDRSKLTQDWRCMEKDQSVHIMALP